MSLISLSEVATMLGLSIPDTEVLARRSDFPSPTLVLPKYIYWQTAHITDWLARLHIDLDDLRHLIAMTQPDPCGPSQSNTFYRHFDDFDPDDVADGFSIESDLPPDNDDAEKWLQQFGE